MNRVRNVHQIINYIVTLVTKCTNKMFAAVERQSSSTSTDSGLHLQEKVKGEAWPLKCFSMFIFLILYLNYT